MMHLQECPGRPLAAAAVQGRHASRDFAACTKRQLEVLTAQLKVAPRKLSAYNGKACLMQREGDYKGAAALCAAGIQIAVEVGTVPNPVRSFCTTHCQLQVAASPGTCSNTTARGHPTALAWGCLPRE